MSVENRKCRNKVKWETICFLNTLPSTMQCTVYVHIWNCILYNDNVLCTLYVPLIFLSPSLSLLYDQIIYSQLEVSNLVMYRNVVLCVLCAFLLVSTSYCWSQYLAYLIYSKQLVVNTMSITKSIEIFYVTIII